MSFASVAALAVLVSGPARLSDLKSQLDVCCQGLAGRAGYCLTLLRTGEQIGYRDTESFPTASTIKTAVMVAATDLVDQGKLKWTDSRPVPATKDRTPNMSSMWSYFFRDGLSLDLDGWVNLMIGVSDNTATKVVGQWLTNDVINAKMASLGLKQTKYLAYYSGPSVELKRLNRQFGLGTTTPREMNQLLVAIAKGKAASPAACEKMIRILGRQYWDDALVYQVPPDVKTASKSGAINRSRSDTAIVFGPEPYVLTVYTDSQKDQRWVWENAGDTLLRTIGERVWNTLHPRRPYHPPQGADRFRPTGGGVSDG